MRSDKQNEDTFRPVGNESDDPILIATHIENDLAAFDIICRIESAFEFAELAQIASEAVVYHSIIAARADDLGSPCGCRSQNFTKADFAMTFMDDE